MEKLVTFALVTLAIVIAVSAYDFEDAFYSEYILRVLAYVANICY